MLFRSDFRQDAAFRLQLRIATALQTAPDARLTKIRRMEHRTPLTSIGIVGLVRSFDHHGLGRAGRESGLAMASRAIAGGS